MRIALIEGQAQFPAPTPSLPTLVVLVPGDPTSSSSSLHGHLYSCRHTDTQTDRHTHTPNYKTNKQTHHLKTSISQVHTCNPGSQEAEAGLL